MNRRLFQGAIPELLLDKEAVVAAILGGNGELIQGNRGFMRLLGEGSGADAPSLFLQPRWPALLAELQRHGHFNGLFTLGMLDAHAHALKGEATLDNGRIELLCEYDIAELEHLNEVVLELNEELSHRQRDLAGANRELEQTQRRYHELMLTDELTGVANRRHFNTRMQDELGITSRYRLPCTLVMCDIDHFKDVNDRFGHELGDEVLKQFARTLKQGIRSTDFLARIGGEEFALLLPNTEAGEAFPLVERIRESFTCFHVAGSVHTISASFGIAELRLEDTAVQVLQRADKALYRAKAAGRNQTVLN